MKKMSQIHNYYDLHAYKRGQSMFKISRQPTVKSGAVDWATIQFWKLLAKGHSTYISIKEAIKTSGF